jgi:hypothetical protein
MTSTLQAIQILMWKSSVAISPRRLLLLAAFGRNQSANSPVLAQRRQLAELR